MTRITDLRVDLKSESSGLLFKSALAGSGQYRVGPVQTMAISAGKCPLPRTD